MKSGGRAPKTLPSPPPPPARPSIHPSERAPPRPLSARLWRPRRPSSATARGAPRLLLRRSRGTVRGGGAPGLGGREGLTTLPRPCWRATPRQARLFGAGSVFPWGPSTLPAPPPPCPPLDQAAAIRAKWICFATARPASPSDPPPPSTARAEEDGADDDGETSREKAAAARVSRALSRCCPLASYALKRLVRGLGSGRAGARQGGGPPGGPHASSLGGEVWVDRAGLAFRHRGGTRRPG